MDELVSVRTPHHQGVTGWKQTHHWWVGECVIKSFLTRGWTHHLQHIERLEGLNSPPSAHRVRELCNNIWNKNTISLFCTCGFIIARFHWVLKGLGAPTNHKLSNQKFANRHQLFMYCNLAQQRHLLICANLWIPFTMVNLLLKFEV